MGIAKDRVERMGEDALDAALKLAGPFGMSKKLVDGCGNPAVEKKGAPLEVFRLSW